MKPKVLFLSAVRSSSGWAHLLPLQSSCRRIPPFIQPHIQQMNELFIPNPLCGFSSVVHSSRRLCSILSHCAQRCMATGGGGGGGGRLEKREGTTVPRVLLTADPTHFFPLRFPIPAFPHTAQPHPCTHRHPRSLAERCIRGALSPVSHYFLTDQSLGLCRSSPPRARDLFYFLYHSNMQIQILRSSAGGS